MFNIKCTNVNMQAKDIAGFANCKGDKPVDIITVISLSVINLLYINITAIKATNGTIIDIINGIIKAVSSIKLKKLIP